MPADEPATVDDPEAAQRGLVVDVAIEVDAAVDESQLRRAVQAVFDAERYESATVSVAVVDDPTIHRLNRQFLAHDYPTDVLSFALVDEPPRRFEGQIVVSHDTAVAVAADAGWRAQDELLLYVVHGALHLAGHDDHDPAARGAMLAAEAQALAELGIRRAPGDERWRRLVERTTPTKKDD